MHGGGAVPADKPHRPPGHKLLHAPELHVWMAREGAISAKPTSVSRSRRPFMLVLFWGLWLLRRCRGSVGVQAKRFRAVFVEKSCSRERDASLEGSFQGLHLSDCAIQARLQSPTWISIPPLADLRAHAALARQWWQRDGSSSGGGGGEGQAMAWLGSIALWCTLPAPWLRAQVTDGLPWHQHRAAAGWAAAGVPQKPNQRISPRQCL